MAATLNPQVLPWIAPVCLILVFLFTFFPWVGYYYGSYSVLTQNAWQAAFGGYSLDALFDQQTHWNKDTRPEEKPGPGAVMIFFLFLGLIPAIAVAITATNLQRIQQQFKLPPGIQMIVPWRWLIVAAIVLAPLFFLTLQIVAPYSIESRTRSGIDRQYSKSRVGASENEARWMDMQAEHDLESTGLRRTGYMRFCYLLLLIAVAGAALTHWVEHRGPGQPLPRFELHW